MGRRAIVVLGLLQVATIVVGFLGARLAAAFLAGHDVDIPGMTAFTARFGLWLLLVPVVWAVVCLRVEQRQDVSDMLAPALIVGGSVLAAAMVAWFAYVAIVPWFAAVPGLPA